MVDQSSLGCGRRTIVALLTAAGLMASAPGPAPAQGPAESPKLADYFGFQPLEVYKLERTNRAWAAEDGRSLPC